MSCSACSSRVEKAVNKLDGIDKASVNLLTNSMQASYDENVVSEQDIIQAVVDAGYGASPAEGGSQKQAGAPQKSASVILLSKVHWRKREFSCTIYGKIWSGDIKL